jgi:eukaryotic-like serine/threonine-protein kinase
VGRFHFASDRPVFSSYSNGVLARSLPAVVPALPVHSSSTGTSYYIQQRTALFARVAAMCSAGGITVQAISDLANGGFRGHAYLYFLIANLTLLALWGFARGKPRPLRVVRGAELIAVAVSMTAAGSAIRLAMPGLVRSVSEYCRVHGGFVGLDPGLVRLQTELAGMMTALLASTQILALRAALVPSSFRHSLAMVAVVGLPLVLASGAGHPAMLPAEFSLLSREHGFLSTFGLTWWLFTSVVCAVIARIVHRLQAEVAVARRLGQYELGEKLGEGGMGIVYRAHHALMKRPVAVKLLPPEQAGQDAIVRFEREVQLASQLSHPNTVVIHDYGRTPDGVFYYAMELIEGPTLERIVGLDGMMPSCRVVHVLRQVAAALAEAHEHGLVHRDIKPANILLGPRGGEPDMVKVLDFGLVRSVRAQAELTNAGSLMGTPLYMSPEAIKSPDRVDGRSDIYSLGAVAYYLLTRHHVFQAETAIEICTKHLHDPPAPLEGRAVDLDPELGRLVLDCLAKDPAQRPGSARELLERLERCPTRGDWTRERAQAWWDNRKALLCRPSKPMATAPTMAQTKAAASDR